MIAKESRSFPNQGQQNAQHLETGAFTAPTPLPAPSPSPGTMGDVTDDGSASDGTRAAHGLKAGSSGTSDVADTAGGPAESQQAKGDQNTAAKSPENRDFQRQTQQNAQRTEGDCFADAIAAIMRLPLSDAEKAEAVRRLLAAR